MIVIGVADDVRKRFVDAQRDVATTSLSAPSWIATLATARRTERTLSIRACPKSSSTSSAVIGLD
jgi:hypothetical protein